MNPFLLIFIVFVYSELDAAPGIHSESKLFAQLEEETSTELDDIEKASFEAIELFKDTNLELEKNAVQFQNKPVDNYKLNPVVPKVPLETGEMRLDRPMRRSFLKKSIQPIMDNDF